MLRLYQVGRLEDPTIIDRLTAEAVGVYGEDVLAGLRAPVLSIRRACAQLSLTASPKLRQQAVETILTFVSDPVARRLAAHTLLAFDHTPTAARRLARDRNADVRLLALGRLLAEQHVDEQQVVRALMDPSRRVRDLAQYHARQLGVDAREHYREQATAGVAAPAVIAGVGEVGQPSDAECILHLTEHPRARVRSAAVAAIGRLAPQDHDELLYRSVNDGSASVSRAATRALSAKSGALDPGRINDLISQSAQEHVARNAILLIERADRWEQPRLYLDALAARPQTVPNTIIDRLRRWSAGYGRAWATAPSQRQLQDIVASLPPAKPFLPDDAYLAVAAIVNL